MRIVLVNPAVHASGGARDTVLLARMWVAGGHDVTLITLTAQASDLFSVDRRVKRVPLHSTTGFLRHTPAREIAAFVALRRAIRAAQPDVVISNWNKMNVATLLATPGRIPVVIRDHHEYEEYEPLGPHWERLRRWIYRRAHAAVVPNPDEARWMESYVPPERIHVIPLSVDAPAAIPTAPRTRTVLAAGRLLAVKGFDVLLEAFASSLARQWGWALRIVGDGPERACLESKADELGITRVVSIPGRTEAMWDEYATAGMFVLSSHLEAFGVVLPESMAAGCPVISTDCPTGPCHIVTDGVDGLLVPPGDPMALAATIDRLAADPELRVRLGSRARETAGRYSPERILARWDGLFASLQSRRVHGDG